MVTTYEDYLRHKTVDTSTMLELLDITGENPKDFDVMLNALTDIYNQYQIVTSASLYLPGIIEENYNVDIPIGEYIGLIEDIAILVNEYVQTNKDLAISGSMSYDNLVRCRGLNAKIDLV